MYEWTRCKDALPPENGYYDVTTAPIEFVRVLRERWWFEPSRAAAWKKEKVVAWRKSLDHIPYEGEI